VKDRVSVLSRAWRCTLPAVSILIAACATTQPQGTPAIPRSFGLDLLRLYVWPETLNLRDKTTLLQEAMQNYCGRPADAATRVQVEQRFAAAVSAWARVEVLRFGPLVEDNRQEHFFFWPDPRGVLQRQVRTLLAAADPAVLAGAQLRQQSAAVQGLPALEYALYADDAPQVIAAGDAPGRYRCAYAGAIAANLSRLAAEIESGWSRRTPLAKEFARPTASGHVYRSSTEVATEALKALSTALHVARDQKLAPALGASRAEARGTLLPLHHSGLTAAYLAAGVQALDDFHVLGGLGATLPAGSAWVDAGLHDELLRVLDDLEALQMPASRAVGDADQRDLLVHAALLLANARAIVDEYLVPALGVNLGFNSLDGD
jgi:uncharacterized protein